MHLHLVPARRANAREPTHPLRSPVPVPNPSAMSVSVGSPAPGPPHGPFHRSGCSCGRATAQISPRAHPRSSFLTTHLLGAGAARGRDAGEEGPSGDTTYRPFPFRFRFRFDAPRVSPPSRYCMAGHPCVHSCVALSLRRWNHCNVNNTVHPLHVHFFVLI